MTHPFPAAAFILAAIFLAPSVAANPVEARPVDPPPLALGGDLVNDTLAFVGALREAQSAEEAANITLAFVSSSTGAAFSQLCQYWTDRNLLSLAEPVILSIPDWTVEWRLPTTTEDGDPAVTYHKFRYHPDDMDCTSGGSLHLRPGRLIEPRTPDPLDVSGEVMRLFDSVLK